MKRVRLRRVYGIVFAVAAFVACGESLIRDPSFDLWCGKKLCAPWESAGQVTRVKTWHRSDFGVELGDDAMLSQLSTHEPVSCIEFDVIADVVASAQVWLEMDFGDDGSSEFKELIPESHWAKLKFSANAPRWYEGVRFILRKTGHGRAVLAQITATSGGDCGNAKKPLPATHRVNSMECTQAGQCEGGACEKRPPLAGSVPQLACGECGADKPCPDGQRCGSLRGEFNHYAACVPLEQDTGATCDDDSQCGSRHCLPPLSFTVATCAECASDEECPQGQVCGLRQTALGPARACRASAESGLGHLCAVNTECASGVCQHNVCAECSDEHVCDNGARCSIEPIPGTWFGLSPSLCDERSASRLTGEACVVNANCKSGRCEISAPACFLCDSERESCPALGDASCGLWRRDAGTCR